MTTPAGSLRSRLQVRRALTQGAFFILFALAPVFDIFRYDLVAGHAWLFGMPWRIGLDAHVGGQIDALTAATRVVTRLLLPILGVGSFFLLIAWRWGRLYCGWLCPHFSVVETINRLMRRAAGKHSIWDRHTVAMIRDKDNNRWIVNADGSQERVNRRWWLAVVLFAVGFAFLWAVVLLTYLLPPFEVYGNLIHGTPTRNQALFLTAATIALSVEFLFARHLFCRYACAVGLFQSLVWMANRKAMVVGFHRRRVEDCQRCPSLLGAGHAACEEICPMRLNPRSIKRHMFACTQCAQCINACSQIQASDSRGSLLAWTDGVHAAATESGFTAGTTHNNNRSGAN
ncbi:MAG: 4Fe-4S binding protein [Gammaproteobacteria bacterium]